MERKPHAYWYKGTCLVEHLATAQLTEARQSSSQRNRDNHAISLTRCKLHLVTRFKSIFSHPALPIAPNPTLEPIDCDTVEMTSVVFGSYYSDHGVAFV
jgi:hypothetical protein